MAYVRVLYRDTAVNINLDGMIRTFSDIAKAAAIEHLGMTLLEAHIPAKALSMSSPVVAASKDSALASLRSVGSVELSDDVNRLPLANGAWFLLFIDRSRPGTSGWYKCGWCVLSSPGVI